ncbi:MAG: Ig-like domain-containing protein, partial [Clostridia bacterium]|nr:Ig-like domain-containing protein [Clostridia bacterium]
DEQGNAYHETMKEGDTLQLSYKLIDCEIPDNGYVKWYSEAPTLVDVDQNGLVKAFDSSKGAVIHNWIDNEVKPVPLVGKIAGAALEKALFNDKVNVDTMDTDEIIALIEKTMGADSALGKIFESYSAKWIESLRKYLDNINSVVHVTLYDANGEVKADDKLAVTVTKNDAFYANFLPNGTHITNKSQIETTVAKGTTCQLSAVTTPVRLHMGVVYSVKSSSVFTQGKVIATVDDSGLVTFKNTGTVTIVVSPDTEGFINNLLKLVNYIYKLDHTGTIDTKKLADILIKYLGIDIDRNVLAALLDACFAIKDIVGDSADAIQLTATAVKIIANILLKLKYNDTITFNVVDGVPCTDFNITGPDTVQEGAQIQMAITDAKPVAADVSDITWSSSDESVAYVDPQTGIITGRDAGGNMGTVANSKKCTITATSAANQVVRTKELTVTGKTGRVLSDAVIHAQRDCNIGDQQTLTYTVYPVRVSKANNLNITWGLLDGTDADGNPKYLWAGDAYDETVTDETTGETTTVHHDGSVEDGIARLDKDGNYTALAGGTATVVLKASTGYKLLDGSYYTISQVQTQTTIFNGLPVSGIDVTVESAVKSAVLANSVKLQQQQTEVAGETLDFATVTASTVYDGSGVLVKANVDPADATNKNVKWYIDNTDQFELKDEDKTAGTVKVVAKASCTSASSVHIWCVSEDGDIQSDVVTLCVVRNAAKTNTINGDDLSVINGKTLDVSHAMTFSGSTSSTQACYGANWYSSDESVLTVAPKGNDNGDAVVTGVDVGTATLYCASVSGGIVAEKQVTVYPDKDYLKQVINICEDTVIERTNENKTLYKDFSRKLDYAYYVYYDEPMAAQDSCDTYARELLYAFYKLGGYIGLTGVTLVNKDGSDAGAFRSVKVSTSKRYDSYSVDLDAQVAPKTAMYRTIKWSSDNDSVKVDANGIVKPAGNKACQAKITVTATDYMDNVYTDSMYVAFANDPVTGIKLDTTEIVGGKVGESQTLKATVEPTGFGIVGKASVADVIWSTSDPEIATVDQSGVVSFKSGGDCVVTVTTCDGGYTAQCKVNVVTNYDALQAQIDTYKSLELTETNYYPATWQAFQDAIAESQALIDANASSQKEVDAQLEKLIAAYKGLEKYTHINNVEIYLDGEEASNFYQYDVSLLTDGAYKDAKLDLNVRLYPNNANYASVTWTSSTDKIVISENGVASPAKNTSFNVLKNEGYYGKITCTVTDHFGQTWTDDVWVSFAYTPATGITISESAVSGSIGDTHQLTATVQPSGTLGVGKASISDLYWESDNENIATVDDKGLVTFVSTGATTVRAIAYDGGYTATCSVSTGGDRSALQAALEKYKDTDYQDYEYTVGITFKQAYEEAQSVMNDNTKTQDEINQAAQALVEAGAALEGHQIIKVQSIDVSYVGYSRNTAIGSYNQRTSGTIGDNDALSIDLSKNGYANTLHENNKLELSAAVVPTGADSNGISWTVDDSKNIKATQTDGKLVLSPSSASANGWAKVTVTNTDHYSRTLSRSFTVVMSGSVISGVSLDQTQLNLLVTQNPVQLNATLAGSSNKTFNDVTWTSSNPAVATVENGLVTPVDVGDCTITVKTLDGGYTATCAVTVRADYSVLEAKYAEYQILVNQAKGQYIYTEDSLAVLETACGQAKVMIDSGLSTQAEIDAQVELLESAHNGLVKYIIAEGVSLTADTEAQANVTIPNPGHIRYLHNDLSLKNKTVQLSAVTAPAGGLYKSITWSSSNDKVTVSDTGLVTNTDSGNQWAEITCTITTVKGDSFTATTTVCFTRYAVTGVSMDTDMVHGSPQDTMTITPTVTSSATIASLALRDCTFTSDHPEIATVDNSGKITFVSQGKATITATTVDGGYTATVIAYTTYDFSALQQAIADAGAVDYKDYAYDYGMAFKTAYDKAVAVNADYESSQDVIDATTSALKQAQNALAGHEFVGPGEIGFTSGGAAVTEGKALVVDDNQQVTLSAAYADGAMVQDPSWTTAAENNVTATTDAAGNLVLTKTNADASGSVKVTYTLKDAYDRTYTKTITVKLVNQKINIDSFKFTYDGNEVESVSYGCSGVYTNKSIQLGVSTYPTDADAYVSALWTSNNKNLVVDQTGKVSASGAMFGTKYTATITCTLTLEDGSTVTNSIQVTFNRF